VFLLEFYFNLKPLLLFGYLPLQGKGLSQDFVSICFKDFLANDKVHIWLETKKENQTALSVYEKFGFVKAFLPKEKDKIVLLYLKSF
jgi:ribosomal protein S18 acetylase RimI-like enzyme